MVAARGGPAMGRGARGRHGEHCPVMPRDDGLRGWRIASTGAAALLATGFVSTAVQQTSFLTAHPWPLMWIAGGIAAGLALFRANGVGMRLSGPVGACLGAGVLAVTIGFGLQNLVNGALARVLPFPPDWGAVLFLALGAALCQTAGKLAAIALVLRTRPPRGPRHVLAAGLAVGLGFGLAELIMIGQNAIAHQVETGPSLWMAVWERAAAVAFHTYSGSLLAVVLRRRRWTVLALVVGVQTATDVLVTATSGHLVTLPLFVVECAFTLGAFVVWAVHRRVGRRALADGAPW